MSELAKKVTDIQPAPAAGVLSPMVQAVINGQMTPETLQQMLEVQKDYERNEAEKAFHRAVADFKKNPPKVVKDKNNSQYKSKYVSKAGLVNVVNSALSIHGLSASWDFDDETKGVVKVTCILSHEMGFSKSVSLSAPPDSSGQKNPIQQIKSTITYLQIATYEAVTGVAASEEGDDDGNGVYQRITEDQVIEIEDLIKDVGANRSAFLKYMQAKTVSDIRADQYDHAKKAIEKKRSAK